MAAPKYLERDLTTGQVKEVIATETGPASEVIVSTTSGGTIDPSLLPTSGSTVVKHTIVDFGSLPQSEMLFTITDASVSPTSHIIGEVAYDATGTGKDLDEFDMDAVDLKFGPGSGQFELYMKGLEGYLADKFVVNYVVG